MRDCRLVMIFIIILYVVKITAKLIVGFSVGSEMLIGDGFHNISDIVEAVFVIAAITLARRPANRRFPLGYMNLESIGSLVIGILLGLLSLRMFAVAVAGILTTLNLGSNPVAGWILSHISYHPSTLNTKNFPILVAVTAGSALLSFLFGRWQIKAGRKARSQLVVDDGRETLSDAMIEALTFLGVIGNFIFRSGIPELVIVAILGVRLFQISKEIIRPALDTLLLRSIHSEHEKGINKIAAAHPEVSGIAHLRTMRVGRFMAVVSLKLLVSPEMTTMKQRELTYSLATKILAFLRESGYFDGRCDIRYSYPDEPPFQFVNPIS